MSIFTNSKATVAKLEADLATATAEHDTLTAELTAANESLATANASVESLTAELATANESLTAANATNAQLTADLEASIAQEATFEDRVEAAALARVGAAGHEAPVDEPQNSDKNDEDLKAEYKACKPGQERIDFRAKHPHLFLS